MTFYTKLKKLKKSNNRRFFPSFTLIELLIVIIVIGILISSISFNLAPDKLNLAADNLIKNIRYTQSLALKEDKYQPFPIADNNTENNRSKYWFKQWWQIRFSTFTDDNGIKHYWYEIFSDVPYDTKTKNFDAQANLPTSMWNESIAKDVNGKLLIGHCNADQYPDCNITNQNLDLTKAYGIQKIEFKNFYARSPRLVFDNYGNIFLREGKDGDAGDINPLDEDNRDILTKTAEIKLYSHTDRCIQINITPTGEIYKNKCN